tara:strand:+ start:2643 stop:4565 length:1923 start_codon:yes stop_codon:yes gene_type:complete
MDPIYLFIIITSLGLIAYLLYLIAKPKSEHFLDDIYTNNNIIEKFKENIVLPDGIGVYHHTSDSKLYDKWDNELEKITYEDDDVYVFKRNFEDKHLFNINFFKQYLINDPDPYTIEADFTDLNVWTSKTSSDLENVEKLSIYDEYSDYFNHILSCDTGGVSGKDECTLSLVNNTGKITGFKNADNEYIFIYGARNYDDDNSRLVKITITNDSESSSVSITEGPDLFYNISINNSNLYKCLESPDTCPSLTTTAAPTTAATIPPTTTVTAPPTTATTAPPTEAATAPPTEAVTAPPTKQVESFIQPNTTNYPKLKITGDNIVDELKGTFSLTNDDDKYKIIYEPVIATTNYYKMGMFVYDTKVDGFNSDSNEYQWKLISKDEHNNTINKTYVFSPDKSAINPKDTSYVTNIKTIIDYKSNTFNNNNNNSSEFRVGWFDLDTNEKVEINIEKYTPPIITESVTDAAINEQYTPQCNFVPYGTTLQNCVNMCKSDYENLWEINNGCDVSECSRICQSCTDKTKCSWINVIDTDRFTDKLPPKLDIVALSGNGHIELQWRCIENPLAPVTSYVVNYYKTFVPSEGVKSKPIQRKIGEKNNKVIIDLVENGTNYSVWVYSINKYGDGPASDVRQIIPNNKNKLIE